MTSEEQKDFEDKDYSLLVKRLGDFVSSSISDANVLIVGAGSVGSYMAEHLVRSGVKSITVIDPDNVDLHNLSRSSFFLKHTGKPKVDACEEVCKQINPSISFKKYSCRLEEIIDLEARELVKNCSIIIASTDDPKTQVLINRMAWKMEKVAIFVGLYKGAKGGEIAFSVPGITPCLSCTIGGQRRQQLANVNLADEMDYGVGRLSGEVALGCNIHYTCTVALRLVLDLLCITDDKTPLGEMAMSALQKKTNLLLLGMEPDYWIFPKVFGGVAGQHAFQSLWLEPQRDDNCSVCGRFAEEASDPFSETDSVINVSVDEIRSTINQQ